MVLCLKSSIVFSQHIILSEKYDTLLCFNQERSKFLLKSYYKSEELQIIDSTNKSEIKALKSVINSKDKIIYYQSLSLAKSDSILKFENDSIKAMIEILNIHKKQIRKERSKTFLIGTISTSGFLFMSYLWIKEIIKN